ncbi:MAG: diguanylate cyclase [Crocosphaera sp.]
MSQKKKIFRWTITRKIGGLALFLMSFSLIIIVYSIISLKKIQQEINEIASLDLPLIEISNNLEIHQLEQHIILYKLLQLIEDKNQEIFSQKQVPVKNNLLKKQVQLNINLAEGIQISQQGLKNSSEETFKTINQKLLIFQEENQSLNNQLSKFVKDIELNQFPSETTINQILKHEESLEAQGLTLIETIQNLTETKLELTQKHQQNFFIVIILLGIVAIILNGLMTLIVITGIKMNFFRLSQQISEATQAIDTKEDMDLDKILINSSDELSDLIEKLRQITNRIASDQEQQKKLREHLQELANVDELTGAFNRRKFQEMLSYEIERTRRNQNDLSIIIFDIDFFKRVNDTYGHPVGDQVLCKLVTIVKQSIRKIDSLYRIGGEEFVILCPDTNNEQVLNLAERIRQSIENTSFDEVEQVTISLGVTQFKESDQQKEFINRADKALYKSKENGRNQVQFEI